LLVQLAKSPAAAREHEANETPLPNQ